MSKNLVSSALDAAVVPGFSRIGFAVRSRMNNWQKVSSKNLHGRVIVITGPTSGLGASVARTLAATGASLVLVGRNKEKCDAIASELREDFPHTPTAVVIAEMGNLQSVADASRSLRSQFPRIDVLIHNAGALLNERTVSAQGIEQTLASHVLGPFLMTTMLRDSLRAANGRVITVSSGGMYAAALPQLHAGETMELSTYNGSRQYAIAKRAQVTLNELWAQEEPHIEFVTMHPGWADTPGVQDSIPLFRLLTKPILRTEEQGADTIAWLAAVHPLPSVSGTFWCDREVRATHKTPSTKKSDTPRAREALWQWCVDSVQSFVN
ncbi:MAG: SDR family NAD(P)-dependent oxidoreductase [Acidimicrobiaceae bacterium]|jgi:dehydrogenase/reductase SDR family protein 12|nr:SDR family NAD(P)-dependent oxidoreductase [Ilumatobacteraceae bacterium]